MVLELKHSFLTDEYTDHDYEKNKIINKKAKGTKKCVFKRKILFNNHVDSLFKNDVLLRQQHRFRSDHHKVYTEEANKIALSSNDDKRIRAFDKVTTYPYGTNVFMLCENEMLLKSKFSDKLNSESQSLINESQVLRSEAQSLRNKSQVLRSKAQVIRNTSQEVRNELRVLRSEAHSLRNKSLVLRSEAEVIRNTSQEHRKKISGT